MHDGQSSHLIDWDLAIENLRKVTVNHPHLGKSYREALAFARHGNPGEVAFLVGPSKAGKSILIEKLVQSLRERRGNQDNEVLRCTLEPSYNGELNWKQLHFGMLNILNGPRADFMRSPRPDLKTPSYEKAGPLLQMDLIEHCQLRGVKLIVLESAYNLVMSGGPSLDEQILRVSSFAEKAGAKVLLTSDYPALKRLDQSERLSSKIQYIHLPRYKWTSKTDQDFFVRVLAKFEAKKIYGDKTLGTFLDFSLKENALQIYKGTCGLVGQFKDRLIRAFADMQVGAELQLEAASKKGLTGSQHLPKTKLSFGALQKHFISGADLEVACDELAFGENLFEQKTVTDERVDLFLFSDILEETNSPRANPSQPFKHKLANTPVGLPPELSEKNGQATS